jgi:hypothetical protein
MISAPRWMVTTVIDLAVAVDVALNVVFDLFQHAVVGLQHVDRRAGVDPPARWT